MGVSLSKGGNVNLSKSAPGMTRASVGLGWDARTTTGTAFDIDASAFLLNDQGKVGSDADFIFYNQKKSANGAVEHQGDNTTGEGSGDDEVISVDLSAVPAEVDKIAFAVTIHEGAERGQNFGQIRNAFIRVVDSGSGSEEARYDLTEDASTETAMVFGELYRSSGDWKFRAVGQGYSDGLQGLAKDFGVNA